MRLVQHPTPVGQSLLTPCDAGVLSVQGEDSAVDWGVWVGLKGGGSDLGQWLCDLGPASGS